MSRTPTYGASARIVELVLVLLMYRERGVALEVLPMRLGCSYRTVLRYLAVLRERVVDPTRASQADEILEYGIIHRGAWVPIAEHGRGGASYGSQRRVRIAPALVDRLAGLPLVGARKAAA